MKTKLAEKFLLFWGRLERRFLPEYVWQSDPLTFWRERVLFVMCFIASAFGPLALIPSLLLAFKEGLWSVIAIDSCAYIMIVAVLLGRKWPLKVRGYIACLILYSLGAGLLFILGPVGAGYIWLFGTSVMISTIIGLEAAIWTLVLNALTLFGVSVFIHFASPSWSLQLENAQEKWIVMIGNFLLLNAFVTITTAFMLNGLKRVFLKEQEISANLRQSEERYRIVADFNYDWEYWISPEGTLEYVSPSCERITGYKVDEFMQNPGLMLAIVHPEDRERMAGHLRSDQTDRWETGSLDFRITTRKNTIRWINHDCQAVYGHDGAFLGRRASNRDITERKQIEEKLRLHHERFVTVLDSIDAAIYVADLQTHEIRFMNRHMIEIYGQDMTGSICWKAIRRLSGPCRWCQPQGEGEFAEFAGVHIWQEQDPHSKRWYVNHDRVIKWTDGRPAKLQIATDITELKKMEAELRQSHKMEAIGTLAGGIAHDFNNILSSIIGFTELALDDVEKGTLLEDNLRQVLTAGNRAKDLVKQILAFARQSDEQVKPIQVSAIIKEALKLIRSSIPTTVQINSHIHSDSLIMGNPSQVHQLVMNLCTNAAHAMEKGGGRLDVGLEDVPLSHDGSGERGYLAPGDYLRLTVSDTGIGIPEEMLDSIFEPFFTTKAPGEGTGMGLAVVHGIVVAYGGRIDVTSTLGQGTTFTIYLPVSSKRTFREIEPVEALPCGNGHILFVDDELTIAKMGAQILERLGYQVTTRTSSVEALALFRSRPGDFDLVITDMTMPDMTGDVLSAALIQLRRDIPVILCTGYSKKISDTLIQEIGIKALVYKPVVMKELAETIRRVLGPMSTDDVARSSQDDGNAPLQ